MDMVYGSPKQLQQSHERSLITAHRNKLIIMKKLRNIGRVTEMRKHKDRNEQTLLEKIHP